MKKMFTRILLLIYTSLSCGICFLGTSFAGEGRYEDILREIVTTGEDELPEGKQLIDFLEKPDALSDGSL